MRCNSLAQMGISEWAYWVGAIGTITAVGVAIAVAAHQNTTHDRRQQQADAVALRGILLGIRAELLVSMQLVEERVGADMNDPKQQGPFWIDFPISENSFPFYLAMLPSFHLIHDHVLRVRIIKTYALAKSLVLTFQANNTLLREYVEIRDIEARSQNMINKMILNDKKNVLSAYGIQLRGIYQQAKSQVTELIEILPKS